jgi:hypothetical protein
LRGGAVSPPVGLAAANLSLSARHVTPAVNGTSREHLLRISLPNTRSATNLMASQ